MMSDQLKREDVARERAAFLQWLPSVDASRVKAIDESGLIQGMRLAYGYSRRGERLVEHAPYRRGRRLSLLGCLSLDGSRAVVMHEGTIKRWHFRGFVLEHVLPQVGPGDVVIWDNARIHEAPDLVDRIEARGGAVRPLPRYSPDFSPIEPLWSKLKHLVRKAHADTAEALKQAVEGAVSCVSASDAQG